ASNAAWSRSPRKRASNSASGRGSQRRRGRAAQSVSRRGGGMVPPDRGCVLLHRIGAATRASDFTIFLRPGRRQMAAPVRGAPGRLTLTLSPGGPARAPAPPPAAARPARRLQGAPERRRAPLVLADWLEEFGDAHDVARAELIRLQLG